MGKKDKIKILVAIPSYNCEKQIIRVLEGFDKKLLGRIYKIIVINNRSTDQTVEAAQKAIRELNTSKIEIFTNDQNYSLGGSHKVAFLYGEEEADYVAILHGDNQAKTQELNMFIDEAEKNPETDAILGSRFIKGSKLNGYSFIRIWGNRALNIFFTLITLRSTKDLGSGLNLFKLSTLHDHNYLLFGDTLTFNIDLLLDYYKKKSKLKFIPITWSEEDQVSNARSFQIGWVALKKVLGWRFGAHYPLKDKKPKDYTFRKAA